VVCRVVGSNPGYKGNGKFCKPKNNCLKKDTCDPNAKCTVTGPGKHRCTCKPGFAQTKDGKGCDPINTCLDKPCDKHAECKVTGPGKHKCTW
jgi:stabilin-2